MSVLASDLFLFIMKQDAPMTRPVMATAEATPETETDDSESSSTALLDLSTVASFHCFSILSYQFSFMWINYLFLF